MKAEIARMQTEYEEGGTVMLVPPVPRVTGMPHGRGTLDVVSATTPGAPLSDPGAVPSVPPGPQDAEQPRSAEHARLAESSDMSAPWRQWGPYLAGRQWGTVREDYSEDGDAWNSFPFDHAHARAYRWGEDGLGGMCDRSGFLNFSVALWNGRDPILKERLFGLTNEEGNHGEDVKELYYYLDGTPTHAYMRMLYKYPQAAFPYADLVAENARRRGQGKPEYEIVDTGAFNARRYFDVTVEYAKAAPDDILMRVTVENRGPEAAALHVLPQLWARNTWSWTEGAPRPLLRATGGGAIEADHPEAPPLRFLPLQLAELL